MDDALRTIGRFLWKLAFVVVVTLAAMAVVGLLVRVLFGIDVEEIGAWGPPQ